MANGQFLFPTTVFSNVVWANAETINSVNATVTGSGSSLKFEVGTSATVDGTFVFQEVTIDGTKTTLTSPNIFIKWRAVGTAFTITKITILFNLTA